MEDQNTIVSRRPIASMAGQEFRRYARVRNREDAGGFVLSILAVFDVLGFMLLLLSIGGRSSGDSPHHSWSFTGKRATQPSEGTAG